MYTVTLACLGVLEVIVAGQPITHFPTDKARALLVYLALESGRRHSRHSLTGLLWPDQPQTAALANLRQTLRRLRQTLDESAPGLADRLLIASRDSVELREETLSVDAKALETLMAACEAHPHATLSTCETCLTRLSQAVALYRGDLLAGFSLADAPAFEEWLVVQREIAQQQVLIAMRVLADAYTQQGHYDQALAYATRQLALDPYREEAYRQAMRALAAMGQRTAALAQYERCRQVLRDELTVEPDRETTALYEQLKAHRLQVAASPPTEPAPSHPQRLPSYLTPFIGRDGSLAELLTILQQPDVRLLTIVAVGGMGKTRLAVEVARTRQEAFPDGCFFISLAPTTTVEGMAQAIAAALDLTWRGGDAWQMVRQSLRHKQALLILDNFEHLMEGAGRVVDLLEEAPGVQVIITSRARLNVRGEHVYIVPAMQYASAASLAEAASLPAVRLFVQSAGRALTHFELTEANLAGVLRICAAVHGMPLGLELAAARVETVGVDEMATEIEASADFLAYEWRDAPARQRSMRAVFDWSWGLLGEAEQQALAQLSVFSGGFTREAADRVAGVSYRVLTRLSHNSLLQWGAPAGGPGRYAIHDLLRQFAIERLAATGAERTIRDHHARYYLTLLADQEAAMRGPQPLEAAAVVRDNADNIRQAWFHAVEHGQWALIAAAVHSLTLFYRLVGWLPRGLEIYTLTAERLERDRAAHPEQAEPWRGLAAVLLAQRALFLSRLAVIDAADAAARAALAEARSLGDRLLEAFTTLDIAIAQSGMMAQYVVAADTYRQALTDLDESLAACHAYCPQGEVERLRITAIEIEALYNQGYFLIACGQYDAARWRCDEALQLCRQVGNRYLEGSVSFAYAEALESAGHFGQARQLREQALAFARTIGAPERERSALNNLAGNLTYLGEYGAALEHALAAEQLSQELGLNLTPVLHTLGWISFHLGEYQAALDYERRALNESEQHNMAAFRCLELLARGDALGGLGRWAEADTAYAEALSLGREMKAASAIISALAGRARVALAGENRPTARRLARECLALLAGHRPASLYEPLRTYLTCYQALAASGEPRADEVLGVAHDLLMEQASWIEEPTWRHSFLENVTTHRELQRLVAGARPAPLRLAPRRT